jgi:opacity protein-like surface antigen
MMKGLLKKVIAVLLVVTFVAGNAPVTAKAAIGDQIVYDLCRPVTGVISNQAADKVNEEYVIQGIDGVPMADGDSRRYVLTTETAGTNWQINNERSLPIAVEGRTEYLNYPTYDESAGTTGFSYFKWGNTKSNWDNENRTVMYLYGGSTLALDLQVPEDGVYAIGLVYYNRSTPRKLDFVVNGINVTSAFAGYDTAHLQCRMRK